MADERLLEVQRRAAARLLRVPGVTAVGLGGRERGGRATGEVVLKVFVERKRPAREIPVEELLPVVFAGVGVDVAELPAPVGHTLAAGADAAGRIAADPPPVEPPLSVGARQTTPDDLDKVRYRPLRGGVTIIPDLAGGWFGTLGCILTHTTDPAQVYGLTVFHVFARTATDPSPVLNVTQVGQPNTAPAATKCCSNLIGTFGGGAADTLRDAALVRLDPGQTWRAEVTQIGPVTGVHTVTLGDIAALTYQVSKRGARTGLTGGVVESINTTATTGEGITRNDLMVIRPNPDRNPPSVPLQFGAGGDSGAVVVNANGEVVGVHIAGSGSGDVRKGFSVPIDVVLAQFQAHEGLSLQVATATALGQDHTVPGSAIAARTPAELPARQAGIPPYPELFGRVGADLGESAAGRTLLALWLDHHEELLDLVNHHRRVTIAWHRGGGPALLQTLVRIAADGDLPVPHTVNGDPPARRIARIHAALHAAASPELRDALDRAYGLLPDPAGLTYERLLAALAAVEVTP